MNAISRMVGGPLDRSEAVDHGHPDDFRAIYEPPECFSGCTDPHCPYSHFGAWFIRSRNGHYVDQNSYDTEDAAEEAIGKMIDEQEDDWKQNHCSECRRPLDNPCPECAWANYVESRGD